MIHTFPSQRDEVYDDLLGYPRLDGPSLQLGDMRGTHEETLKWVLRSRDAGRPWFVCLDEIGPAKVGVMPDADDPGHDDVRVHALWGNLMAGGSGCEWLFGYDYPHNDITCEDWRSRAAMWDLTRVALDFFQEHLPFPAMQPRDDLIEQGQAWCLAKPADVYAVYLFGEDPVQLKLAEGRYEVSWYDPRCGGALVPGGAAEGPGPVVLNRPNADAPRDWAALVRKVE